MALHVGTGICPKIPELVYIWPKILDVLWKICWIHLPLKRAQLTPLTCPCLIAGKCHHLRYFKTCTKKLLNLSSCKLLAEKAPEHLLRANPFPSRHLQSSLRILRQLRRPSHVEECTDRTPRASCGPAAASFWTDGIKAEAL